jgi:hypothetical protein
MFCIWQFAWLAYSSAKLWEPHFSQKYIVIALLPNLPVFRLIAFGCSCFMHFERRMEAAFINGVLSIQDLQCSQRRFCTYFCMKCRKKVWSLLWTCKMIAGIWFGTWEFYHCWLFQASIKIVHYKSEGTPKWFEHLLQTLIFHPGIIYAQIVTCLTCEMWYVWYLLPVFCGTSCWLPGI